MKNEILLEVWRNRDKFAQRCNYDLDVMVKTLQKVECDAGNPLIDRTNKAITKQVRKPLKTRRR